MNLQKGSAGPPAQAPVSRQSWNCQVGWMNPPLLLQITVDLAPEVQAEFARPAASLRVNLGGRANTLHPDFLLALAGLCNIVG
jgi:hypothetical protein